uniref:Putative secreted protein n=1 Tax=Anopheles marajoara TaxID=58244 RepID=A0A2M4C906_9DIPT
MLRFGFFVFFRLLHGHLLLLHRRLIGWTTAACVRGCCARAFLFLLDQLLRTVATDDGGRGRRGRTANVPLHLLNDYGGWIDAGTGHRCGCCAPLILRSGR